MADSSQKFIARNRAPRVQIEYDVELYGAEKKVQLPFVMGVMSDLVGKSHQPQPAIADRKFLEIDVDNFDERMRAMAPRAAFTVPNTLTGEGNLAIDLTFESMSDFTPGAVAAKVDALRPLLEARQQLEQLMTYMDGKSGAEELIETVLKSPALLSSLAGQEGESGAEADAALQGLREMESPAAQEGPDSGDVLGQLAAQAPDSAEAPDTSTDILAGLSAAAPADEAEADRTGDVLSALADAKPLEDADDTFTDDALSRLAEAGPATPEEDDQSAAVLTSLAERAPDDAVADTAAKDALAGLAAQAPVEAPEEDTGADVLDHLAAQAPVDDTDDTDAATEALSSLAETGLPEAEAGADADSVLQGLEAPVADEAEGTQVEDVLSGLDPVVEDTPEAEVDLGAVVGDLERPEVAEDTGVEDVLSALDPVSEAVTAEDPDLSDMLGDLQAPEAEAESDVADVLSGLEPVADTPEAEDTDLQALLGDDTPVAAAEDDDDLDNVLAGLEPVEEPGVEGALDLGEMLADAAGPEVEAGPDTADVLSAIAPVEAAEPEAEVDLEDLLGDLDVAEPEDTASVEDVLTGIEAAQTEQDEPDADLAELLGAADTEEPPLEAATTDVLATLDATPEPEEDADVDLNDLLGDLGEVEAEGTDATDDILAGLDDEDTPAEDADTDLDLDGLLDDLGAADDGSSDAAADADAIEPEPSPSGQEDEDALDLDDLLGDLDASDAPASDDPTPDSDLDDLLGDQTEVPEEASDDGDLDLDALLAGDDRAETADAAQDAAEEDFDLDALLADEPAEEDAAAYLDAPLTADQPDEDSASTDQAGAGDDLDDLLAGLDIDEDTGSEGDDLDALFADLEEDAATEEADDLGDLDALLGDLGDDEDSDVDLDALLGDDDAPEAAAAQPEAGKQQQEPELAYGTMSADRPEPQKLERKRFRLAIFGDFTGRASKGQLETGDALAERKPMVLDPDTFEDVIESFATELVLPIGKDGAGISVKLGEYDDLHPDELYDNVELFSELVSLRKQLQSGVTKDHAMKTLSAWAEAHGTPARAPKSRSGGNAVPADKRLSDFQMLIGDSSNSLRPAASPVEDLLARVVGPHIRALPDPNFGAMQEAVDQALSDAMRLVLHHPEFQSVEAQWRSLDLIQRSVEVDDTLDVMLYDISAEELAADLAAHEDLSQSGFVRLLTEEPMDEENGRGAFSALIGLYTFEETPPHAELLGRFARVAAHVDAPFLAAITPGFWDTGKEDRPKVVADAWDTLAGMPEAGHLGLLTPRFLLRRPYGARGEPIDPFDFEEFTQAEGLRGMLWGNPVVVAAILMAKSFKENGASLQLGSIMSLGEMPFHYVNDRFGDQVALPCTERNVDLDKIAAAKERGFMPIASVRGRDEIRLTSFNALRGDMLLGPWTGQPAPAPAPPDPRPAKAAEDAAATPAEDDDLGLDFDFDDDGEGGDDDLDALLAGFGDDDDSDLDGDIDADLEALLNDL